MINKARYEELKHKIEEDEYGSIHYEFYFGLLKERILTDWENNKEQLSFLINTIFVCENCGSDEDYIGYEKVKDKIDSLEEYKKFLKELANKYGVILDG